MIRGPDQNSTAKALVLKCPAIIAMLGQLMAAK